MRTNARRALEPLAVEGVAVRRRLPPRGVGMGTIHPTHVRMPRELETDIDRSAHRLTHAHRRKVEEHPVPGARQGVDEVPLGRAALLPADLRGLLLHGPRRTLRRSGRRMRSWTRFSVRLMAPLSVEIIHRGARSRCEIHLKATEIRLQDIREPSPRSALGAWSYM